MFQDIAPHVFNNEYDRRRPAPSDYLVLLDGRKIISAEKTGKTLYLFLFCSVEEQGFLLDGGMALQETAIWCLASAFRPTGLIGR